MKLLYVVLGMIVLSGCTDKSENPLQPSGNAPMDVQSVDDVPTPSGSSLINVGGRFTAHGCVDISALDPEVFWTLSNLPEGTRPSDFALAYNWDDTPGCSPTEQGQRTQNGHIAVQVAGAFGSITYDRDTILCKGRVQLDATYKPTGQLVVGTVINIPEGKDCKTPPPPEITCPVGTVPTLTDIVRCLPPPPQTCPNEAGFDSRFTQTSQDGVLQAEASVAHAAEWKLSLYAAPNPNSYPNTPSWTKDTDMVVLTCGSQATLQVSFPWHTHTASTWWYKVFQDGVEVFVSQAITK